MNNMPKNWTPPAPAWTSLWKTDEENLVCGLFAIQGQHSAPLDDWAKKAFTGEFSPKLLEQGMFTDKAGITNYLYIAYWFASDYKTWWQQSAANSWWASPLLDEGDISVWREVFTMPHQRFETLHSSENAHGAARLSPSLEGPMMEHGYSGAARDRIPCSSSQDIKNDNSIWEHLQVNVENKSNRIKLSPPKNMCVIRSGQDWTHCEEDEKEYYLTNVHTVLKKGMDYLSNNPVKTHCASMRFITKTDGNWCSVEQTFGLGYGNDIYAFENWAKSHPTHIAIFDRFMGMVEKYNVDLKLQLWHEVTLIPEQDCEFEYINCHGQTGLLCYINI